MSVSLGVDVGQRRERSAVCVVEIEERRSSLGDRVDHFSVRHLERLPAQSSFPEVARRTGEVISRLRQRHRGSIHLFVDVTGLGEPVLELVKKATSHCPVQPVYFTHGDRRIREGVAIRLGKAWLVSRLQTLLQTDLLHLPDTPVVKELASDLMEFDIKVAEDANERYGAFPVGHHDDLVTALGLAVQETPARIEFGTFRW